MVLLLPFLWAVFLFGRTLSFPLMYDTLLHTQLADGQTVWSVFLPNEQFGFYRPLVFLPIVLVQNMFDQYPAGLFHGLNVVTHALNVVLLACLVWRLTQDQWESLAAGLLFASFPFAYQALAIYGNNPYLTSTFFILLGLNAAMLTHHPPTTTHQQPTTDNYLLITAFLLGVLVHETAVLLLPLVLFVWWMQTPSLENIWPTLKRFWPLIAVGAIYLAIYPFLPRGGGPQLDFGGNALGPKILLFLQTAAWPLVLSLFQMMSGRFAILLGFGLLAVWAAWQYRSKLLWLGGIWFLLASVLIGVTLPTYYIQDGARLLYPGGAGVALIWTALCFSFLKDGAGQKTTAALLVIGLVGMGSWFNWRMISLYEMGSRPIAAIGEALNQERGNDDLVLVNLPQWTAWPKSVFPAGTEFAPVMGSHLFALELVRANYGVTPEITVLDVPEALAEAPYNYGVYRLGAVGKFEPRQDQSVQIVSTAYEASGPVGRWAGSIGAQTAELAWSADSLRFGNQTACALPNGSILFESEIWAEQPLGDTKSLFVQALSAEGLLVAQNDGPPLSISPQRLKVPSGLQLLDRRVLVPEGEAAVVLSGVYDFMSGEREQALLADGESLADNGFRTAVQPCSN